MGGGVAGPIWAIIRTTTKKPAESSQPGGLACSRTALRKPTQHDCKFFPDLEFNISSIPPLLQPWQTPQLVEQFVENLPDAIRQAYLVCSRIHVAHGPAVPDLHRTVADEA